MEAGLILVADAGSESAESDGESEGCAPRVPSLEAMCQYTLACNYENGIMASHKHDDVSARMLYAAAARSGHPLAQYKLGMFYKSGRGKLERSVRHAARWLGRSAAQGCVEAQMELGWEVHKPRAPDVGTAWASQIVAASRKDAEALKWLRVSAELGHVQAMYTLGLWYAQGRAVKQNFREATKWFHMARDRSRARELQLEQKGSGKEHQHASSSSAHLPPPHLEHKTAMPAR
ncbi:protein YbeT [Porphyridium purpureum]|uniref:Protein YbeT n=1 Tax=Porphyridium purpureum TaxID=35688 RepID=A0A5J4YJR4_PORPP|nr:protein YbeT [Porphyridium purpureum]|eukprot:POR0708..scf246_12